MKLFTLFIYLLVLSGCSSMGVEPWERDLLAKQSMQPVPNYFENFYDEHIYFRRDFLRLANATHDIPCRPFALHAGGDNCQSEIVPLVPASL